MEITNNHLIIGAGAFVFIVLLLILLRPKYKRFKQMLWNGTMWTWRWRGKKIYDLKPVCPSCDAILTYDDEHCSSASLKQQITFLVCDKCGGEPKSRIYGGNRSHAMSMVKREIWRLIHNGEYQRHLK